jgi:hypothetical protein
MRSGGAVGMARAGGPTLLRRVGDRQLTGALYSINPCSRAIRVACVRLAACSLSRMLDT